MLRSEHEAEGSQAAPVVRLTPRRWIVEGARIRDGDGRRLAGTAVGVADGAIVSIGTPGAVRRGMGAAERLHVRGATLLPGLIDPHVHVAGMAADRLELDCGRAASVGELLRAIRAAHRRLGRGDWLRGAGLDETALGRLPTASELERVAPGRPIRLRHRSRHASVVSAAGLARLAGLVPDRHANGTGLVVGREAAIARATGPHPEAAMVAALGAVGAAVARRGVTTLGDASPRSAAAARRFARLLDAARLGPRVVGLARPGAAPWTGNARLACGGVKILVEDDGDGMRPRPATLRRLVTAAAARGQRVAVHCVTLGTLVAALEAFAALPRRARAGRGHRLEHLGECPPALVAEIARLGLVVVGNPAFLHGRGDAYLAERSVPAAWLYRVRSLLRAGVPFAAASDAPVAPCDPWNTMAAARERRTRTGVCIGPSERLSAVAALACVCRSAADALGRGDLGRLAPGGPADLVVVDRDPVVSSPADVRETRVLLTMIAGEPTWLA